MLSGINYVANSRKSSRSTAMKIYCLYRLYLPQNWHVSMQKTRPSKSCHHKPSKPPSTTKSIHTKLVWRVFCLYGTYCTKWRAALSQLCVIPKHRKLPQCYAVFVMFSTFCIHLHAKVPCTLKVEAVLRGMAHLSRLSEASEVPSPTAERGAWRK